jgi:hypothetical protein
VRIQIAGMRKVGAAIRALSLAPGHELAAAGAASQRPGREQLVERLAFRERSPQCGHLRVDVRDTRAVGRLAGPA